MKRASYGQAAMQAPQAMHFRASMSTMPSSRTKQHPVGHTGTHGGFSQCRQASGRISTARLGNVPTSVVRIHRRFTPRGTSFSTLQATEQAAQPTHEARSIAIAKRVMPGSSQAPCPPP